MTNYQAISVKCKAMGARLLNEDDYDSLSKSKDLEEFFTVFNALGKYDVLRERDGDIPVSRGLIESYALENLVFTYDKLRSFSVSGAAYDFIDILIKKIYLGIIIELFRVIQSGGDIPALKKSIPPLLLEKGRINWPGVFSAKNASEFIDCLSEFDNYCKTAKRYLDESGRIKNTSMMEIELLNGYYQALKRFIDGHKDERGLNDIFCAEINEINREREERLESFGIKEKRPYLIPLGNSDYKKTLYETAYSNLHSSSAGLSVIFGYLTLKNIEKTNITRIAEGVRYSLLPDEIKTKIIIQ